METVDLKRQKCLSISNRKIIRRRITTFHSLKWSSSVLAIFCGLRLVFFRRQLLLPLLSPLLLLLQHLNNVNTSRLKVQKAFFCVHETKKLLLIKRWFDKWFNFSTIQISTWINPLTSCLCIYVLYVYGFFTISFFLSTCFLWMRLVAVGMSVWRSLKHQNDLMRYGLDVREDNRLTEK